MSKAIKCDCCNKCSPEINPLYSFRKRWAWRRYDYDSQGGSYATLDICVGCWGKLGINSTQPIVNDQNGDVTKKYESLIIKKYILTLPMDIRRAIMKHGRMKRYSERTGELND